MSILDGLPRSAAEAQKILELTGPMVQRVFNSMDLTPKQRSMLDLLNKGFSLADIYGLTQDERDAMFAKGCQLVQAGDIEKARDWLIFLHQLDPLDARIIYVIAVTYQTQGNFSLAAKLYIFFIARDATNPEGYLRLGECLLSARDYGTAADCFQFARTQCERGKGDAVAAEHATKMLAHALEKHVANGGAREIHKQVHNKFASIEIEGHAIWLTQPNRLHQLMQRPT